MSVGLWMTPALLGGVSAVLWLTRLARLVGSRAVDAEKPVPEPVESETYPELLARVPA